MRITIPFRPHFRDAMIQGRKIATSRTKKYGSPGDEFEAFGFVFVLERYEHVSLDVVALCYHEAEGFAGPNGGNAFRLEWEDIHPISGFRPEQRVWIHWFRRKDPRHQPHFVPVEKQMELDREYMTDQDLEKDMRLINAGH